MGFVSSHVACTALAFAQTRVRLGTEGTVAVLACVGLFVLFILGSVAFGMRRTFGGMAAMQQLAATGTPALGRVISVRDLGGSIKFGGHLQQQRLQIDLEVDLQNGQPIFRTSAVQLISILHLARLQPGAVVPVRYDPANPARVALAL